MIESVVHSGPHSIHGSSTSVRRFRNASSPASSSFQVGVALLGAGRAGAGGGGCRCAWAGPRGLSVLRSATRCACADGWWLRGGRATVVAYGAERDVEGIRGEERVPGTGHQRGRRAGRAGASVQAERLRRRGRLLAPPLLRLDAPRLAAFRVRSARDLTSRRCVRRTSTSNCCSTGWTRTTIM